MIKWKFWERQPKLCEHVGKGFKMLANVTRAPLLGGHWTNFMLFRCACGELVGFPDDNYQLALTEGTDETKQRLGQYPKIEKK